MACCEALIGRKLPGIKRCPASAHERADNIQTVIWELSHTVLQTDLSHISSKGVVAGDPVDIHNLLEILSALLSTDDQLITTGNSMSSVILNHSNQKISFQMSLQRVATCAEVQEQSHGDDSCAHDHITYASHNVQPNASQMHADSDAAAEHFCSPGRKPSRGSQDALHQQYTLTAATAPSPASVRPKHRSASTSSHHKAAQHGANHSSQCSQCIDSTAGAADNCSAAAAHASHIASADGDSDASGGSDAASQHQEQQQQGKQAHVNVHSHAAEHVRQHQQQGRKSAGKAAGGKRKLRVKKQSRRAPLVMPKCYAAAVAPAQQDGPWQVDNPGHSQDDRSAALLPCGVVPANTACTVFARTLPFAVTIITRLESTLCALTLHHSALSQGNIPSVLTYDRSHGSDRVSVVSILLQERSDSALPMLVLLV